MKRKTIIHVLLAGIILLSACEKNTDIFVPDPGQLNGPDTSWQSTITTAMPVSNLKTSLLFDPYIDTIEVNNNIASVLTPFGVQVNFPANSCVSSTGQPVTGRVDVEIMLLKKKGDMIRQSKPTTYNDSLLVTAGEIFIILKKNGLPVQLAPNAKINVRYTDIPTNQSMKLFVGDESNAQQFNWLPVPISTNNILNVGTQNYEIYTNHLRWISVSYGFDLGTVAKVNVTASLAPYFTNANTVVFTVFKDFRSVAGMYGDINTRKFSTGKLPVGKAITVVVISKQANDYYLGFESAITATPTNGTGVQTVSVTPIKRSLPDILYYLSTL
ncbi:MAG: hypothetical protein ABI666_10880 [Ferruginibacter sp.]